MAPPSKDRKEQSERTIALRVSATYVIFGVLWILLSDQITGIMIADSALLTVISVLKGLAYVGVTGFLFYRVVYGSLKRMSAVDTQLTESYSELETAHEVLAQAERELKEKYVLLEESQRHLAESEERYRLISDATNDGIWDETGERRNFGNRWYSITGYSEQDIEQLGSWTELIHPSDQERRVAKMEECKRQGNSDYSCEFRLRAKNGEYKWILSRARIVYDDSGQIVRVAGSHTDITQLKQYQGQLEYLAYTDSLSHLPNRLALSKDLGAQLARNSQAKGAVFFADIDNFKYINDSSGHVFGDDFLRRVAERLQSVLRPNEVVYRFGGDEFIVHSPGLAGEAEIPSRARQIVDIFREPFQIGKTISHCTVSIGVASYPDHGLDVNQLIKCADIAMYKAKKHGRNGFAVFDQTLQDHISERVLLETNLRSAVKNDELQVYYQPQIDVQSGRICGYEALLRWFSPTLGTVSPLTLISIAENTLLILPIGEMVLRRACRFIKRAHEVECKKELVVAVNVSVLQLTQDGFVDTVFRILAEEQLDPRYLELEITESVFMESFELIVDKLKMFRQRGVGIALDDFGKGYSSLSCLKQLPIGTLKVDKSFIDDIGNGINDDILVNHIMAIGQEMGLSVVAEGVESDQQLAYLSAQGCSRYQGYIFSRPVNEEEALNGLVKHDQSVDAKFLP